MKNKIAITIQNYVQYYCIHDLVDELMKDNIVHVYVPICTFDEGFNNMYNDMYDFLIAHNYTVYRESHPEIDYKIVLLTYNFDAYFEFNCKYKIKYTYYVMCSKPQLLYKPDQNEFFDAMLTHSTYERDVCSVYAPTYLVGAMNFKDFKKKKSNSDKKTVLYLPTYGNLNTIDNLIDEFKKLKKKYRLISKIHHGTSYLLDEKNRRNSLLEVFDEVHDDKTKLNDLLAQADVVLSDNSGAVFDAIYLDIPVCMYTNSLSECDYEDLQSPQHQLVEKGVIPYTNDCKKISEIIDEALSKEMINKQRKESKILFPLAKEEYVSSNLDVINMYLRDEVDLNRYKLRRIFAKDYFRAYALEGEVNQLKKQVEDLNNEIVRLNNQNEALSRTLINRVADRYRHFKERKKGE